MRLLVIFALVLLLPLHSFANGKLTGSVTNIASEPIIGASVSHNTIGTLTSATGHYELDLPVGKYTIKYASVGYQTAFVKVDIVEGATLVNDVVLEVENKLLNSVTITSDRYEQSLSEVTVSTDILKPELLESTNATSVDEVLVKVPGVDIIDGQPNIRGGAGFSYGAGSRVLLLVDDIPYLQADAGFPHWDDIPVENIAQIEIVKGAGSALYGSSALNGIINVRTAEAGSNPYTKVMTFYTGYSKPGDPSQAWWERKPFERGQSFAHRSRHGKTDLILSGYSKTRASYNRTFYDDYNRLSLGLKHYAGKGFTYGLNANTNTGKSGQFFFWKSLDSLYSPSPNTFSNVNYTRFNVDPYIKYSDTNGNKHKLLGRYHFVNNRSNNNQSNSSKLAYGEYQYQKHFKGIGLKLTSGAVYTTYFTEAELYGDTTFTSQNVAVYTQLSKKIGSRLSLAGGFRYEHNTLRAPALFGCEIDPFTNEMDCDTVPNGKITDAKPVFRLGTNYQAGKATFLRASWGQGYRFPTIAERFIKTTFGGIPISPNPGLVPETGWSAELGIKQGYRLGSLQGFADASVFWSQYQNMMEFNLVDIFPTGFQSLNIGSTDIKGIEFSLAGQGNLGATKQRFLIGYTHINPRFGAFDTSDVAYTNPQTEGQLNANASSSKQNVLKYRYRHTVKADWETTYKSWFLAGSANYYSFMEAVDAPFESVIVPQLKQFRSEHKNGDWIIGARLGTSFAKEKIKCSFIANNLLNRMYSLRPGLMEAPRSITLRLEYRI